MKATDLRIGNYVNLNDGEGFHPVIVDLKILERLLSGDWEFEPITITEEWLIKFGLKRKEDELFYLKEEYHPVLIESDTTHVVLDFREENNYVYIKHDLQYVHLLQNLYFVLNDKEL